MRSSQQGYVQLKDTCLRKGEGLRCPQVSQVKATTRKSLEYHPTTFQNFLYSWDPAHSETLETPGLQNVISSSVFETSYEETMTI